MSGLYWMFTGITFIMGVFIGVVATLLWIIRSTMRIHTEQESQRIRELLRRIEEEGRKGE